MHKALQDAYIRTVIIIINATESSSLVTKIAAWFSQLLHDWLNTVLRTHLNFWRQTSVASKCLMVVHCGHQPPILNQSWFPDPDPSVPLL